MRKLILLLLLLFLFLLSGCTGQTEHITLGSWEGEPLTWQVLKQQDDRMLVLCDQVVDTLQYNPAFVGVVWENTTARKWLNEEFLQNAVTEEERARILLTTVSNAKKEGRYGINGGADT